MFPHLNATSYPTAHSSTTSGESVALFVVVTLFGFAFLLSAITVWFFLPSALEGEEPGGARVSGGNSTVVGTAAAADASAASARQEREKARLEYVHKALRTRSWHGGSAALSSIPSATTKRTRGSNVDGDDGDNDNDDDGASLTISTVPSGASSEGCEEDTYAPSLHLEDRPRRPDPESGTPTSLDVDLQVALPTSPPPPAPVTPCGSFDSEFDDDNNNDDKKVEFDRHNDSPNAAGLDECAICLCPFQESEQVCLSSNPLCTHLFHPECLEPWLLRHEGCPVCRETYLPAPSSTLSSPPRGGRRRGGGSDTAGPGPRCRGCLRR